MIVPKATIQSNPLLQQAMVTPNGTPIDVAPLGKIYFKLKTEKQSPQIQISLLQAEIRNLKATNKNLQTET
eukprot:UN16947